MNAINVEDPIAVEIVRNSLQAISDEMFSAMWKTAMSPIIYEVLDYGVAITDADGNLTSSGAGLPAFIGMLDKAVRFIVRKFARTGKVCPDDIFMTNDPYNGGVTHLNDVCLMMPIFADGEIVAWTANMAHWNDLGGIAPGSASTDAVEIFQEAVQFPGIKLFEEGRPNEAVLDIIRGNSRLPDQMIGDMWAGIASIRIGKRRVEGLIEKFGVGLVRAAMAGYLDYGESVARRALKNLPKGVFSASDPLDDGRMLNVAIEITDEDFLVDLDGCPNQDAGPYNMSFDGSLTAVELMFKCITSPTTVCNGGTFRLVRLKCREGSIFNAQRPAAQGMYYEAFIRLFDVLWKALAPAVPEMMSAAHFGSICATIIGGIHPDTGRHYNFIEPELGGWGAGKGVDGSSAQFSAFHGDTYICPVEISEARNGLLVDQICLNRLPGGEGEFRGGRGVQIDYRLLARNAWVTVAYTRNRTPPWGLDGGKDGSVNYIEVLRKCGAVERYGSASGLSLAPGDVVRITTGNGGGYGDPRRRPIYKVLSDVRNELITKDYADAVYDLSNRITSTRRGM